MVTEFLKHEWIKQLKVPLLVGCGFGIIGCVWTIRMPNLYTSETRILPADARGGAAGLGQIAAAAAVVGVSIPGQDSADAAYVDILNSRWLRERLLQTTYRFHYRSWRFGPEREVNQTLLAFLKRKNVDQGLKALKRYITVNRDLKTKLISISVETSSAELSQQLAQDAVKNLETFILDRTRSKGGAKAIFTEQRLREAREASLNAESEFRQFLEHDHNYQTSNDPSVRLKGLRLEMDMKLRQQLLTTLAISLEQALLEEKNDMPILNVMDKGNLPTEKSGPARSQIVGLLMLCGVIGTLLFQKREKIISQLREPSQGGL